MQTPQPSLFPLHGENCSTIPDRYLRAIEGFILGWRQKEIARHAGVCERTIRYWLTDPLFVQALDMARTAYWTEVEGRLHESGHRAVDALLRNLESERPHAQIAAARLLLQHGESVARRSHARAAEIEGRMDSLWRRTPAPSVEAAAPPPGVPDPVSSDSDQEPTDQEPPPAPPAPEPLEADPEHECDTPKAVGLAAFRSWGAALRRAVRKSLAAVNRQKPARIGKSPRCEGACVFALRLSRRRVIPPHCVDTAAAQPPMRTAKKESPPENRRATLRKEVKMRFHAGAA